MPEVKMWKATDGTLFESQAEHDSYMSMLEDAALVDEYLDTQEWAKPAVRTKAKTSIMGFLDWKNRDKPAAPKEVEAA